MDTLSTSLLTVRDRLGMSQKAVAERMGLSASLISKWEKGDRTPDSGQLYELAHLYGVTPDFLMGMAPKAAFQPRAQTTMPADEKHQVGAALNDAAQQIHFIHKAWALTGKAPARFGLRLDWADPELPAQAELVRTLLKLNRRTNLQELKQALAEQNVLIFDWHLPAKLYGLSYRQDFTVIFLNRSLPEPQRLFTLAHELAHLIYHLHDATTEVSELSSRNDPHEKQANRFASEFLLPQRELEIRVAAEGKRIKQPTVFHQLAREWNVSAEALFYRLVNMEKMRWSEHERFFQKRQVPPQQHVSRVGLERIPEQVAPALIAAGLDAWTEEKITGSKLSEWWFAPIEAVDDFLAKVETIPPEEEITLGLNGGDADIA